MFFGWFRDKKEKEQTERSAEKLLSEQSLVEPYAEDNTEIARLRQVEEINDSNYQQFFCNLRDATGNVLGKNLKLAKLKLEIFDLEENREELNKRIPVDQNGYLIVDQKNDLDNQKIQLNRKIDELKKEISPLAEEIRVNSNELLGFVKKYLNFMLDNPFNDSEDNERFLLLFRMVGTEKYLKEKGYLPVLLRKASRLIYHDEYGDIKLEKFLSEVDRFIDQRDLEEVNEYIVANIPDDIRDIMIEVDRLSSPFNKSFRVLYCLPDEDDDPRSAELLSDYTISQFRDNVRTIVLQNYSERESSLNQQTFMSENESEEGKISPYEYEEKIGQKFKILGWKILVTKASGDQGADVIIEKGEHRGVVQCKMYSQPVGNKAVQEVHAAKSYYDATFSVVVSNQDYTPSARMLATKLGVYLINDSDIRNFSELF